MLIFPIALRHIDRPINADGPWSLEIGDCWYADMDSKDDEGYSFWFERDAKRQHLSDYYFANNSWRKPICVTMPGQAIFCVDSKVVSNGVRSGGWTVTGDVIQSNLTVHPSINMGGTYHGYVTQNLLQSECEGRLYHKDGSHYRVTQ